RIPQLFGFPLIDDDLGGPGEREVAVVGEPGGGEATPAVLPPLIGLARVDPGEKPEIAIEPGSVSRDGPTPKRALLGEGGQHRDPDLADQLRELSDRPTAYGVSRHGT